MKHLFTTRLISFVLVLVMVLGMFPGNTVHVHAANVEDDQAGASILSVTNDDTNLEIDYEKPPYKVDENGDPVYDEKGNLIYLTPQLALSETAEAGLTITDSSYDEYSLIVDACLEVDVAFSAMCGSESDISCIIIDNLILECSCRLIPSDRSVSLRADVAVEGVCVSCVE